MTVIMTVVRMGPFFSQKLSNGQTSSPPKTMQPVAVKTSSGTRLLVSSSSRRSTSAINPNTTAPMSPPQRRARRVRAPCGGKDSSSLSAVAAWSASVASRSALSSASPVSGSDEGASPESAAPGRVPGSVSG